MTYKNVQILEFLPFSEEFISKFDLSTFYWMISIQSTHRKKLDEK
jgi:hypothetical protein